MIPCFDWFSTDSAQTALSHKRRKFLQFQTEQLCQSAESSLSTQVAANQSLQKQYFSLVSDQLLSHLKQLSQILFGWFLVDLRFSVSFLCQDELQHGEWETKRYPIWVRPHRGLSIHLSDWDHIFVSRSRRFSPCVARRLWIHGDRVGNFLSLLSISEYLEATIFLVVFESSGKFKCFWSFLSRRVSSYLQLLFAILENLTMRLDWILLLQVSLYLTNLFGCLEYPQALSTQSDFAESKNLLRQWKPSSSSAMTLLRSFLLLLVLASFFAIVFVQLVKLKFWEQKSKVKCLMLNKWRRLFHSFSQYVCEVGVWCRHIWFESWVVSRLILSNNQSRTTLWVLDTCLIVGLPLAMIILITASLSSKIYSIAPNWEDFAFEETWSTLLRSRLSCWVGTLVWFSVCSFDVVLRDEFLRTCSLVLLDWVGEGWNTFFKQILKIKSWDSIDA